MKSMEILIIVIAIDHRGDNYLHLSVYHSATIYSTTFPKTVGWLQAGFVVYAPRAGAARCTGYAIAWPLWAVQRSSEFIELSPL